MVLVEAARAGWGASGRNGGQVGRGYNWDAPDLVGAVGLNEARALWAMADAAAALTRDLIAAHAPEANYRPGVVYLARSEAGVDRHRTLARSLREDFGDTDIQILDGREVTRITGSAAFRGGALDRASGHCNPLAYTQGLARAARSAGLRLYEGTTVRDLIPGTPYRIQTQAGEVIADRVILATNGYHDGLVPRVANHVLPINNYIAVTEPLGVRAPMTSAYGAVDDRFVVNYWHQSADGRLVYGGGETYGKRFPKDIAAKVRRNLARVYPDLAQVRLTHAWGGTLAVTTTRLPYAAELAPGLLTVGGYSGHGLALAGFCGAGHGAQDPWRWGRFRSTDAIALWSIARRDDGWAPGSPGPPWWGFHCATVWGFDRVGLGAKS